MALVEAAFLDGIVADSSLDSELVVAADTEDTFEADPKEPAGP